MNLERLEEAREWWDENKGFLWQLLPHETWKHIAQSFDAARLWRRWGPAVEAAEEVWWCKEHELASRLEGWCPLHRVNGRACRMEPVLVVRPRLLAEEET